MPNSAGSNDALSIPKGPLSVFSASKRWTPPRSIHFTAEEGDLGFTLRGNSPVQVHFLDPYCSAAVSAGHSGLGAKLTGTLQAVRH